jgi:glycerol transport system ATP-binding protein
MALELKNITKRVGAETHIYETSLTFDSSGFNVLLGDTNAGKTTLIKIMAGLEKPTSGEIWMDGVNVTGMSPQKRNISLVHQFFVNYPHMSVFENIASPLRVAGMAKSEIAGRVQEAADILQLGPMLKRRPQELSGGQQQRTALARAIVKESSLVLLDEPLANLDYKLREELRDQLPDLFAGRGAIVVYATSEPEEALMLGGRTATVFEGRVTQFGDTAQTYKFPVDLISAEVFSNPPINTAPATKTGKEIRINAEVKWQVDGAMAALPDGEYTVGIRSHYVTPVRRNPADVSVKGEIYVTELSGSESTAHFNVAGRTWVSQAAGVHKFDLGEVREFFFSPVYCYLFGSDGRLAA